MSGRVVPPIVDQPFVLPPLREHQRPDTAPFLSSRRPYVAPTGRSISKQSAMQRMELVQQSAEIRKYLSTIEPKLQQMVESMVEKRPDEPKAFMTAFIKEQMPTVAHGELKMQLDMMAGEVEELKAALKKSQDDVSALTEQGVKDRKALSEANVKIAYTEGELEEVKAQLAKAIKERDAALRQISAAVTEKLAALFDLFDQDGSGVMEIKELDMALHACEGSWRDPLLQNIMQWNGAPELSKADFIEYLEDLWGNKADDEATRLLDDLAQGYVHAQLKAAFQELDQDGSGTLSRGELVQGLRENQKLAKALSVQGERLGKVFDALDADRSGSISFEEFVFCIVTGQAPKSAAPPSAEVPEEAQAKLEQALACLQDSLSKTVAVDFLLEALQACRGEHAEAALESGMDAEPDYIPVKAVTQILKPFWADGASASEVEDRLRELIAGAVEAKYSFANQHASGATLYDGTAGRLAAAKHVFDSVSVGGEASWDAFLDRATLYALLRKSDYVDFFEEGQETITWPAFVSDICVRAAKLDPAEVDDVISSTLTA
eukprot:CAMPEP_0183807066 /NCGR_PEP_ID=MMETSP0803_2-20130417/40588_1 /TAXON_ID=195967 /ORGANISM="Crustomastix stigmata, Strain CCMP3273" /LENGTH=548 /DNA_ID=CAMNT_0026051837 /DNA_START=66 /DNA_END=1709 /DNA_ORIENTATION=-